MVHEKKTYNFDSWASAHFGILCCTTSSFSLSLIHVYSLSLGSISSSLSLSLSGLLKPRTKNRGQKRYLIICGPDDRLRRMSVLSSPRPLQCPKIMTRDHGGGDVDGDACSPPAPSICGLFDNVRCVCVAWILAAWLFCLGTIMRLCPLL